MLGYIVLLLFALLAIGAIIWMYKERSDLKKQLRNNNEVILNKDNSESELQKLEHDHNYLKKELKTAKIKLAKLARDIEEKDKLIHSLTNQLDKFNRTDPQVNAKLNQLYKIIESHQENENNTFQIYLDDYNQEYILHLKKKFPQLTLYDLRLCTYIKNGFSTREIAKLTNVLPSSIHVSRSRLRKKLGIDKNENLFSYLEAITEVN